MTGRVGLEEPGNPKTEIGEFRQNKGNEWWWLRLIVAIGFLFVATTVAWRTFVERAIQVWNSPAALIFLVISIEFVWFVSHVPDGGAVAWLKMVLGACALLGALPGANGWSATWFAQGGPYLEPKRILVALLAAWVVADGVRDRRLNLRRSRAGTRGKDNTPRPSIAASSSGSERH